MNANNELKIEQGIPMPPARSKGQGFANTIRKMQVGDSFVIPKNKRMSALGVALRIKVKVASRTISADEVRVWRTE